MDSNFLCWFFFEESSLLFMVIPKIERISSNIFHGTGEKVKKNFLGNFVFMVSANKQQEINRQEKIKKLLLLCAIFDVKCVRRK